MKKIFFPLFFLLGFIPLLTACGNNEDQQSMDIPSTKVTVVDGDTIKVQLKNKQETIRLLLIDTPELHDRKTGAQQPYSQEAKNYTTQFIQSSKFVTIEKDKTDRDKYHRLLAYVYADHKSIQESLLQKGLARVAYVFPPNVKYEKQYRSIEKNTQQQKTGIWSVDHYAQANGFHPEVMKNLSLSPSGSTEDYVASKNSEVYHPASCKEIVDTIKPDNRIYYHTEQEAIQAGKHRSKIISCWKK
ncbi:micrococcal nuclease [Seinonella peptonophila]|uniref:Micrococcal nuclease n=1 Tax=Seinonella peptonophila TaxID=112248 RepID=A0A1M4Y5N2_9BACL|nr:thermonuclease family protein [Seinonella peptonophila]SHF01127.1 micrococcal nuclease [Seinonella peptonophila]